MFRVVLFLVCYTSVLAGPINHRVVTVEKASDINKDIQEFLDLIPAQEISTIVKDYVENDNEVKNTWNYMHSPIVKQHLELIERSNESQEVLKQLQDGGLDIPRFMLQLNQIITLPPFSLPVQRSGDGLRGLLMNTIRPLIPEAQIKLLSTQKFIFSSDFRRMSKIITSSKFKESMKTLVISKAVKDLENGAIAQGITVDAVYEFIASFNILYEYLLNL